MRLSTVELNGPREYNSARAVLVDGFCLGNDSPAFDIRIAGLVSFHEDDGINVAQFKGVPAFNHLQVPDEDQPAASLLKLKSSAHLFVEAVDTMRMLALAACPVFTVHSPGHQFVMP